MLLLKSEYPHFDDLYEYYDPEREPLPQRQQLILTPASQRRPQSSPSSGVRSLRRTPRLQERRAGQAAVGGSEHPSLSPEARPVTPPSGFDESGSTSPQNYQRLVENESYWPTRTTRISRHTHDAILFALEAIRRGSGVNAQPLTPDLLEEQARMSDLLRGNPPGATARTQNGGAPRTTAATGTGPTEQPPRYRTPTDVMRERRRREALRAEEAVAKQRQEEERRLQQEAQIVGVGEEQRPRPSARTSTGRPQPTQTYNIGGPSAQATGSTTRRQENIPPAQPGPSRTAQAPAQGGGREPRLSATTQRNRTEAFEQLNYPTTARPAVPEQTSRPTQQPPPPRPQAQPLPQPQAGGQAGAQPGAQASAAGGRSRFPNAFERWEDLSAHWEGIVSSFIHRLQNNADELAGKPLEKQMARQIDDLSAAGANLFHAVVELQRLRASSERKFQRWFFETRHDQEQAQERIAELERQLRVEREAQTASSTSIEAVRADKNRAEELVKEMRRELQISKEEARRAWEELGRREQEERERTIALRSGERTLIGGVEVVPMQGLPSRQVSSAQRPQTREGPTAGAGPLILSGQQPSATQRARSQSQTTSTSLDSPGEESRQFTYQPETGTSPTVTDPFTESSRQPEGQTPLRREPDTQFYTTPPRPTQPNTSAAAIAASRAATSATQDLRYYQSPTTNSQMSGALPAPIRQGTGGTERSYIPSSASAASEEEYHINPDGSYTRDAQGHRIPYHQAIGPSALHAEISDDEGEGEGEEGEYSEEDDDDHDHAADIERERMYAAQYRPQPQRSQPQGTNIPRTTSGALPPIPQGRMAEYEGQGYGDEPPAIVTQAQTAWENLQATPHRHPTRLSDIIEETTQRTSPSARTSYASGGTGPLPLPGHGEGSGGGGAAGAGNTSSRR
ncbi:hypothetical protein LTR47_006805 [Exophiala xenobiotica]|nr:hypothetical protein LTR47_006805 [Exophiala xenobiotica]KAK5242349.1 hypothetical protein LTS06_011582 [Exophiala xenobiotica]KAK5320634.1 hypothetical protein LTR93_006846 [Exophiala xenobiotica]KAK5347280.1 hypothetical protein LTR61_008867 [Exophiala xenobiotica]KAK5363789.1 hypothetical protein LTR11_009217 [Exophiala xenobiotica]